MPHYTLALETPSTLEEGKVYITLSADKVHYVALRHSATPPLSHKIEGEILLEQLGITPDILDSLNSIEALAPYSSRILSAAGLLEQPLVEVPTLFEGVFNGDQVSIGIKVNQFDDLTDPDFIFVYPTIYVQNPTPAHPRHVLMLVDVSGSMGNNDGAGIQAIHNTLPKVFEGLNADDRISLVSFSDKITTVIANRSKQELLSSFSSTVASLQPTAGTALNDAILSVAEMPDLIPGHTTVLLLTDGQDGSSGFKARPATVVEEFNRRFYGLPPRLFPIGLGAFYDHEFIKQCSIATNFGMIDARDQTRLGEHVTHILNGLAMGIHVGLKLGEGDPIPLGIVSYNTANVHTPKRVRKAELASKGLEIYIGGQAHAIPADQFLPAPDTDMPRNWQALLREQAKQCYDNTALSYTARMDDIEALASKYDPILDDATRGELTTLLQVLDKKMIVEAAGKIVFTTRGSLADMLVYQCGWREALKEAIDAGQFQCRYPSNQSYVEELIPNLAKGYDQNASISRVPAAAIQATDSSTTNRFTSVSTLTSHDFTATLSRPPMYPNYRAHTNVITLDRRVDFSKLPEDVTIESCFEGRETVRLRTNSALFQATISEARSGLDVTASLDENMRHVTAFVCSKIHDNDLTHLSDNAVNLSAVDIDDCLDASVGVCRHQSLFTATLIGKLVEQGHLPAGEVTHYRAATNALKAHSLVVYTDKSSANTSIYYLIDPAMNLQERIATQADFERCVTRYNECGLDWILRNFARDHDFSYPEEEDLKPIGQDAILRLELQALNLDRGPQMHFINQLRRDGLIPDGEWRIRETPENKTRLWATLVKYGCIFPEETTEIQQAILTDAAREQVTLLEARHRQCVSGEPTPLLRAPIETVDQPLDAIKQGLNAYIEKVEITYGHKFDYGFSFFKASQAENRSANYRLAKELLRQLSAGGTAETVFSSKKALKELRCALMSGHKFRDHGIHSNDLNKVLNAGIELAKPVKGKVVGPRESSLGVFTRR